MVILALATLCVFSTLQARPRLHSIQGGSRTTRGYMLPKSEKSSRLFMVSYLYISATMLSIILRLLVLSLIHYNSLVLQLLHCKKKNDGKKYLPTISMHSSLFYMFQKYSKAGPLTTRNHSIQYLFDCQSSNNPVLEWLGQRRGDYCSFGESNELFLGFIFICLILYYSSIPCYKLVKFQSLQMLM